VGIFDTDAAALDLSANGTMPFMEAGADALVRELLPTGRLSFSAEASILRGAEIVVIVLGTTTDEFLNPSMEVFDRAVGQLQPYLRDGMLVILRSTAFPGTTSHVTRVLRERGCTVDVCFCPERIA